MHPRPHPTVQLALLAAALRGLAGCNAEVVQTATLSPNPLDCSALEAHDLPTGGVFGDGTEPPSPLLGTGYAAGEGPGLFVTARGAFRVTLNGERVVVSAQGQTAVFVPLTLLPGPNALSVVVSVASGTPAALLQLDELSRSYVSAADWKVNTAPMAGFQSVEFDDDSWDDATDYGVLGSRPGCDPETGFATNSNARWIGPAAGTGSTAVLRKVIHVAATGYGAGTEGGRGLPVVVDAWEDLESLASEPEEPAVILLPEGTHDFRDAPREQLACPAPCADNPDKTQHQVLVEGATCATDLVVRSRTDRRLDVGSNKTLVGLGRGAHVRGVSFNLDASENVIVRNLAVYDVNPELVEAGDAFSLGTATRVWLDHCTTKWISDDFTSVLGGRDITLSWLHFDGVTQGECQGQHTRTATWANATVTAEHSFFDHVRSHSPRVEGAGAHVHLLNNLLSDNPEYGVGAACGARVLMEGNTFERVATPTLRTSCSDDATLGLVLAPPGSNHYGSDVGDHEGGDGLEPRDDVPAPPYTVTVATPSVAEVAVRARAGAGGPWRQPLELD